MRLNWQGQGILRAHERSCRRLRKADEFLRPDRYWRCCLRSARSTGGWEAHSAGHVEAGWMITGSWPIDTERARSQLRANAAPSRRPFILFAALVRPPTERSGGCRRMARCADRVAQADSRVDAPVGARGRRRCGCHLRLPGTGTGSLQPLQPGGEGQRRTGHAPGVPGVRLGGRFDRGPVDDLR